MLREILSSLWHEFFASHGPGRMQVCVDRGDSVTPHWVSQCAQEAYRNDEPEAARLFEPGKIQGVDLALQTLGFKVCQETLWWEVVDFLVKHGDLYHASIAQACAMTKDLQTPAN